MKKTGVKKLFTFVIIIFALCMSGCKKNGILPPAELDVNLTSEAYAVLDWSRSDDAEFYRVYRIKNDNADYRFLCDTTELTYTDKTVKNGETYKYKVTAISKNLESEGCVSPVLIASNLKKSSSSAPQTPVITSVTGIDRYTTVIMFEPDDAECTYRIMRSKTKSGPFTLIGETKSPIYYDTSLSYGESYFYTVSAVNGSVSSDSSKPQKTGMNSLEVFSAPVLMYHQFLTPEDVEGGVNFGEYAIWASEFEQDLIWLRNNGYTTITTKELMMYMNGEQKPPKKPIILTIDDGYRGVYLNAWPLLKKYNMKAVFSVIGDRIDSATLEDVDAIHADRLYCNWNELSKMQKSGYIEIISHTATCHNDEEMTQKRRGANCEEGESEEEFYPVALPDYANISKNFNKYFGFSPYAMSYPYSSRSITSDNVWMKCGYQILYAGNSDDARKLASNYLASGAGISRDSAVLRRVARMHGTSLYQYVRDYY